MHLRKLHRLLGLALVFFLADQAHAAGSDRRSWGRFQLGEVAITQTTNRLYTIGGGWNPTLLSLGKVGFDLLGEAILAKETTGSLFVIAGGGFTLHWRVFSFLSLHAGGLYHYWSRTKETLPSPYAAMEIWWDRNAFLQGLALAYSYTDQQWGRAHTFRAQGIFCF